MSELPVALSPWAAQLAAFPHDLALALGPWLQRLSLAVGPFPARLGGDDGELDGLSGLARRGSYERLLLSEWLLAEEQPDEFLRRAAAHEHLFLDWGRRSEAASRRSAVLLDAGPDQLGTPRIAQLAALVVLASRAQAAGAAFAWGILQEPEGGLLDGVTPALLQRLLEARRADRGPAGALQSWLGSLPPPGARDDLWLVGSAQALRDADHLTASRLEIEDLLEPGARKVRLTLRAAQRSRRELLLDLPEPRACVRLLRDPFSTAAPQPAIHPEQPLPGAELRFAANGRRLMARTPGGQLFVAFVPSSPREKGSSPNVFRFPEGEELIAAGWWKRWLLTATLAEGRVRICLRRKSRSRSGIEVEVPVPEALPILPAPPGRLGPCIAASHSELVFLDGAGSLFWAHRGNRALWRVAPNVKAVARLGERMANVNEGDGGVWLQSVTPGAQYTEKSLLPVPEIRRAFLCGGAWSLLAAERADGDWMLHAWNGPTVSTVQLHSPPGTEVVGLTQPCDHGFEPGLVLVEPDRRSISFLSKKGIRPVCESGDPIASAAVSPADAVVGYLTVAGELVAFSLDSRAVLMRSLPGGEG